MKRPKKIVVGIHIRSDPRWLNSTLLSLLEFTPLPFELLLLADGPDAETARFLASCARIGQSTTDETRGAAACFNRLLSETDGDIYVFLENGVTVSEGWLERLLQALDADPAHGLAGPSTNRCWNEQQADSAVVAAMRKDARIWQELGPLYSLADFCIAVKKEVAESIGAADEAYGPGPCWEMDYNIRAAKAGFKGIWVKTAFVHRAPPSAARMRDESRLFEASKMRYQDKFCVLRRDATPAYCGHCEGAACEYFATGDYAKIALPHYRPPARDSAHDLPLVSCIMPTCDRAEFVAQAIYYFLMQDYPQRELLIIYETENDLPATVEDPRIRLVKSAQGSSIGAKRNQGVAASAGSFIAHWDDDDWYSSGRLAAQLEPLLSNVADISALNDTLFLDLQRLEFWACSSSLFKRMFVEGVHGGTLVYRRNIWGASCLYPNSSLREDADFMRGAMRRGARLCRMPGHTLFIYLRHGMNTWKFQEGGYLDPEQWRRVPEPEFFLPDRSYYQSLPSSAERTVPDSARPMVSCIMPTAGRRKFVPGAIHNFLKQDYPRRELIVVDDGEEPVADLIPIADNIRYIRLNQKFSVGNKRNMACEAATGEIIVHWDDDDWMAPQWVRSQVDTLLATQADVCGLNQIFFISPEQRKAWRYIYDGGKPWVYGGTMAYTKSFWRRNRFLDMNVGEDNAFVWGKEPKILATHDGYSCYVAIIHSGNTSPKNVGGRRWHEYSYAEIEHIINR